MSDQIPIRKTGNRVRIMQVDSVAPIYRNASGYVMEASGIRTSGHNDQICAVKINEPGKAIDGKVIYISSASLSAAFPKRGKVE